MISFPFVISSFLKELNIDEFCIFILQDQILSLKYDFFTDGKFLLYMIVPLYCTYEFNFFLFE